jgi:hypothetical protein
MFHDFEIVSRKTGEVRMALTQIGATREAAEYTIRNYNLNEVDFENDYELRDPHADIRGTV